MRADQLLMIGVVGIGAYAAYRLLTSTPRPEPLPAGTAPTPTPDARATDARVDPTLPRTAGAPDPAPATLAVLTGPTLNLRGGAYYKARLDTDPSASNAQIQSAIATTLGLSPTDVQVFRFAADAAPATAIGQPWALARPGQGTRWVRFRVGALNGGVRPRPLGFVSIWQAAAPS